MEEIDSASLSKSLSSLIAYSCGSISKIDFRLVFDFGFLSPLDDAAESSGSSDPSAVNLISIANSVAFVGAIPQSESQN